MPPKNVKKAKKLYEKMKKEKEEKELIEKGETPQPQDGNGQQDSKQATPEPDAVSSTESSAERPSSSAEKEEDENNNDTDGSQTEANDNDKGSDLPHETSGVTKNETDKSNESKLEGKSDEETIESTNSEDGKFITHHETIKDVPTEETSTETPTNEGLTVSDRGVKEETDSKPQVSLKAENDNHTNDAVKRSQTSSSNEIKPIESDVDDTNVTNQSSSSQAKSTNPTDLTKSQSGSELIASLRQANEDLRLQNENLRKEIMRLEGELEMSRRSNLEVSLSPPYPQDGTNASFSRDRIRSSSFVEADLFSHEDSGPSLAEEMEKWKGFQLDIRNWQNSCGIGPIVSL